MSGLEQRVEKWVSSRIGAAHMNSKERALRVLEESIELAQAVGVDSVQAVGLLAHVYARPAGDALAEAGGLAFTLLGWCASQGVTFDAIALAEIERNEARPVSDVQGSLARKTEAKLVNPCEESYTGSKYDAPRMSDGGWLDGGCS